MYLKAHRVLKRLIKEGKRDFAIFPYGKGAMVVRDVLNNQFGIKEKLIISDSLREASELDNVVSLSEFKDMQTDDIVVLLSSDKNEDNYYNDLRTELWNFFPMEKTVDVYSISMYFDPQMFEETSFHPDARFASFEILARHIYKNDVDGDVAEVGVYRGDSAKQIARLFPNRKLYIFDTFEGFHSNDFTEEESNVINPAGMVGRFNDTSIDVALNNIGRWVDVIPRKGYFPDTAEGLEENRFAFVSLDTDLYHPILSGLQFFYPRLSEGGFIIIHDAFLHPGAERAIREFCTEGKIGYVPMLDEFRSAVLAKPL